VSLCITGVTHAWAVIPSSQRALRLVGRCSPIHTGCVRRASTTPIPVKLTADAHVRSATHLLEPSLNALISSLQSHTWHILCEMYCCSAASREDCPYCFTSVEMQF